MEKTCTKCTVIKDTSCFSKDSSRKSGHDPQCKECRTEYYHKNRQHIIENSKTWAAENPIKRRLIRKKWRDNNWDHARKIEKIWAVNNPDSCAANVRRRRARKLNAEGTHTKEDIHRILRSQGHKCAICKVSVRNKFEIDHIVPFCAGGSNYADNLQMLCVHCNRSKGGKDPHTYMREIGYLI